MTNGIITKIAVGLGTAGILGAVGVYGSQMAMAQRVAQNGEKAEHADDIAHRNAVAVAKIVQWIEIDRERTEREHKENVTSHDRIERKLDAIEDKLP